MLAKGIDTTIESVSEKGISDELVRQEVLASTKALTDKIRNKEVGFIDLCLNISNTFDQDFYAKYSLVGLYNQSTASGTKYRRGSKLIKSYICDVCQKYLTVS